MCVLAGAALVLALTEEERRHLQGQYILWVGVLAGLLVLGGVLLGRLDRWRKRQMAEADDSPAQMTSFRSMYERGELSQEEYDRVLRRMAERVGARPKPPPAQPAAAVPPEPEPPATTEEPPPAPQA